MERPQEQARDVLTHIPALDGVRGMAIGLVLLFHLLWANSETGSRVLNLLGQIRSAGWVGVDLFYALSGFLITGILFDSLGDRHYFKNFYVRRVLRIMPLYYGVATLLFLWAVVRLHEAGAGRVYTLLLLYLNNTTLWWHSAGGRWLIDASNHLWSLAVEEQFYLVWPLLIFIVRERRRLMVLALVLAAMAPVSRTILLAHGATYEATYKLTLCRMDSLLGGAWVALAVRGPLRAAVLRWAPAGLVGGVAACLGIAVATGNFDFELNHTVNTVGYSLVALACASWVALSLRPAGSMTRAMSAGWLRFLGKYSYGLYVLHMPVAAVVDALLLPALHAHVRSKALLHLIDLVVVLALTIPLALLSFHFYEKPFLGLKRFFNYAQQKGAAFPD